MRVIHGAALALFVLVVPAASQAPVSKRVLTQADWDRWRSITGALAYAFDHRANVLAYTVILRDPTKDGAFLRTMAPGTVATLASGRGNYKSLTMDSAARQVAFLSGHWSAYENAPEVNRLMLEFFSS